MSNLLTRVKALEKRHRPRRRIHQIRYYEGQEGDTAIYLYPLPGPPTAADLDVPEGLRLIEDPFYHPDVPGEVARND